MKENLNNDSMCPVKKEDLLKKLDDVENVLDEYLAKNTISTEILLLVEQVRKVIHENLKFIEDTDLSSIEILRVNAKLESICETVQKLLVSEKVN